MTIVALNKISLCGLINDKVEVLERLQQLGLTHLIEPDGVLKAAADNPANNVDKALRALKYLQQCDKKRHQVRQSQDFDFDAVVLETLALKDHLIELLEQRDFLQERIKDVALWGDFELADNEQLLGYKLWFYIVPKHLMKQVRRSGLVWQQINQSNTNAYVVVIAQEEPDVKSMPVPRTHIGDTSLSQLRKRLDDIELAIEDAYAKREYLTRWMSLIMQNLAEFENQASLQSAQLVTRDEPDLFVVQAWVASEAIPRINEFVQAQQLACLVESPDGVNLPPTLLKNSNAFAGGEECVKFYQTPNYYAWDPSIVVFFSFALFFAMILSDAGYAILFLAGLAVKWKRLGQSRKGLRVRTLLLVTLSASLGWGVVVGSYFGFSPDPHSVAGHLKLLDMNDFDAMMKLSIIVGVSHIAFANLVQAYQLKQKTTRFAALGWALFVIGGLMLWLSMGGDAVLLERSAQLVLILATLALLVFSSERVVAKPVDVVLRLLDGIMSLTSITKIFGDVLSYMRLFALGLASASLAITFNQLAMQVYHAMPGLGLLFSILILILGHTLNILLGIMSGVVHGLRLNFIEFYNWSVSDEGYPFKAFARKEGNS